MKEFTKGTWTLTKYPHIDGEKDITHIRVSARTESQDLHIAYVDGAKETKANAQLIAAAPAMYEALKAIIDAKALHKTDPLREQIIKALAQAEEKL